MPGVVQKMTMPVIDLFCCACNSFRRARGLFPDESLSIRRDKAKARQAEGTLETWLAVAVSCAPGKVSTAICVTLRRHAFLSLPPAVPNVTGVHHVLRSYHSNPHVIPLLFCLTLLPVDARFFFSRHACTATARDPCQDEVHQNRVESCQSHRSTHKISSRSCARALDYQLWMAK